MTVFWEIPRALVVFEVPANPVVPDVTCPKVRYTSALLNRGPAKKKRRTESSEDEKSEEPSEESSEEKEDESEDSVADYQESGTGRWGARFGEVYPLECSL